MILLYFLPCYLMTVVLSVKTPPEDDSYYATVVEYNPYAGKDANDTLFRNLEKYVLLIEAASTVADIIVFPELGLNFRDTSIYVEIPFGDSTVAPVDSPSLHPVLRQLSKAAKDNKVYVSFTIHEKEITSSGRTLRYNTNVVLDRNGFIVARYRKYHLFNEKHLNIPEVPEVVYFDADFGVRFGIFIGFDIFFKEPALTLVNENNITDIIFPSWWFSELPSLSSVQMQFGWAYMADANLLAAGINDIKRSSTGSGIYRGKGDPNIYALSEVCDTQLITANVLKKGRTRTTDTVTWQSLKPQFYRDNGVQLWSEDVSSYKTYLLTPVFINVSSYNLKNNLALTQILNKTMCQGNLCCEFNLNMTFTYQPVGFLNMSHESFLRNDSYYHYQYRLAIYDGVRDFYGAVKAGIQVCSIMPCLNDSLSSCGQKTGNTLPLIIETANYGKLFLNSTSFNKISIKAFSKNATDFTFPDVLESSRDKIPNSFGSLPEGSKIKLDTNKFASSLHFSSDQLAFAGIYSRITSRDTFPVIENSSVKYESSLFLPVFLALLIIFSFRKMGSE